MASATGRARASAYIGKIPEQLTRLLAGAGRAGGRVIAAEAKSNAQASEVANAIIVRSKSGDGRVVVRITVKREKGQSAPGWAYSQAIWQEYGTAPHFITVADGQRQGLGIRRINQRVGEADGNASLVIGGKFVGKTVFHPGAKAHPFLRPALDFKGAEAVRTAQAYINARVSGGKIDTRDDEADA